MAIGANGQNTQMKYPSDLFQKLRELASLCQNIFNGVLVK